MTAGPGRRGGSATWGHRSLRHGRASSTPLESHLPPRAGLLLEAIMHASVLVPWLAPMSGLERSVPVRRAPERCASRASCRSCRCDACVHPSRGIVLCAPAVPQSGTAGSSAVTSAAWARVHVSSTSAYVQQGRAMSLGRGRRHRNGVSQHCVQSKREQPSHPGQHRWRKRPPP